MKIAPLVLICVALAGCQRLKPMSAKDMAAAVKECKENGLAPVEIMNLVNGSVVGIQCELPKESEHDR